MTEETDQRIRLSLRSVEVFAAIARAGSTRAAAGRVARSQSAASSALTELESVLGVALFDRVGRRLVLNENGRAFLPLAVALTEQALEAESLFSAEHAAPLRVAASFTIGEYILPPLISSWKQANPRSQVRLDVANSTDVMSAVAAFEVDLGFIEGPRSHPELTVKRWRADELTVVAAPTHPLAGRNANLRNLCDAGWILRERGSGTREASDSWLGTHLSHFNLELELGSNEAVKRAVASGLGLGCLSRLAVVEAVTHGWLIELRTPMPVHRRALAVVFHGQKALGAATKDFVAHCFNADDKSPWAVGRASR